MANYQVSYFGSSSSNTTVSASSASDAKAIVESKGNARWPHIVYKVRGPEGTIDYMSYSDAVKLSGQNR